MIDLRTVKSYSMISQCRKVSGNSRCRGALAAFAEIAGCFSFWAWLRLHKPAWILLPGLVSLALFAYLLTKVESDFAGRAYAAYGSIYIAASFVWLWLVENKPPDRWDSLGVAICLLGGVIILFGPR